MDNVKCFVSNLAFIISVTSEVISLRQQLAQQNGMRGLEDSKILERANKLATTNVSLQVGNVLFVAGLIEKYHRSKISWHCPFVLSIFCCSRLNWMN